MSRSFYWLPIVAEPKGKYVDHSVARAVYDFMCERAGLSDGDVDEVALLHADQRLQGWMDAKAVEWERINPDLAKELADLREQMERHEAVRLFYRY